MNPNMLNRLKKMQKEIQDAQEKLELTEFIGKASGVEVIMQGTRQMIDIKINPDLLEDIEMLQDAILVAVNDSLSKIDKTQEETMGQFAGGMGGFGF
ncbi:MAG: YbaB/EbfC family nucleoid-associated protein [Acholeplasmataceae bacterium]